MEKIDSFRQVVQKTKQSLYFSIHESFIGLQHPTFVENKLSYKVNKTFFVENRPHNGLSYQNYLKLMEKKLSDDQSDKSEIRKLNYQRSTRIYKSFIVNEQLCTKINRINIPQLWMVLSEDWCGDSAQNIPYLAKMAECNPNIELKILLRDENPDIMNFYLTDGNRSIPKLVAFDMSGNELFQWGPRPKEAHKLVLKAKSEGKQKEQILNDLHLWYGRNKGKDLEEEMISIIEKINSAECN